jgi:hypothetical protein
VPLRRAAALVLVASTMAAALHFGVPERGLRAIRTVAGRITGSPVQGAVTIVATLHPPAHTGLTAQTVSDPERLTAVEGTRLRLSARGGGGPLHIRFGEVRLEARREDDATVGEIVARESGYFAVSVEGAAGPGARLLPLTVTPDRAPVVRVDDPGRDLLLPTADPVVPIRASATDDYGLRSMALRYTRVSGSGEQFEFVEGELPIDVARESARSWRARSGFTLRTLGLEPGDALVYRVVARDGRPGEAGLASSDTYFIEIAGPGQVALEGFEMPPDRERYALSQQMIVLKIQRLRMRERGLPRGTLQDETGAIAAEQRAVRANFVFLMGGHVEDEFEEAEHSNEIQEGRLENTARREMARAVGHMSYAEQGLAAVNTAEALRQARLAVEALQRAFGRNRYILRTLPVRSRIDPSRRLSGKLDEAFDSRRDVRPVPPPADATAVRDLLAELLTVAPSLRLAEQQAANAETLGRLAERALAAGPGDAEWQQIAARILKLRDAVAAGRADLDPALRAVLVPVVKLAQARTSTVRAARGATGGLRSAWAAEMRTR